MSKLLKCSLRDIYVVAFTVTVVHVFWAVFTRTNEPEIYIGAAIISLIVGLIALGFNYLKKQS